MNIIYGNGPIIRSPNAEELAQVVLEATPLPVISDPGDTTDETVLDEIVTTHSPADYYRNYALNHSAPDGLFQSLENLDEGVAILSDGVLTRTTDGVARVRLRTRWGTKGLNLDMSEVDGGSTQTRVFAAGTLAKHVNDQILDRIDGLTPSTAKPLFSSQNHTTGEFVRNTGCWLSGIDLTCISPSNVPYGHVRAGTAISPRHVCFVRHYPLTVGTVLRFITTGNETVMRTVTAVASDGSEPWTNDVSVGLLDSDLPETISPCKVAPPDWLDYAPNANHGVLVVQTDQENKALVTGIKAVHETNVQFANWAITSSEARTFWESLVPGDSGSPNFLVVNSEIVLLGSASFPYVPYHFDLINSLMTDLGGGYQLTEYDLSSFPNYGD